MPEIKPIYQIFIDLIAKQASTIERLTKSDKTGDAAAEEFQKALKELEEMHKDAVSKAAVTNKPAKEPSVMDAMVNAVMDAFKESGIIADPQGFSVKGSFVRHKSVLVETHGNRDANMALASLFSKDADLDEIVSKASFFAILFFGSKRRILWDESTNHEAAIKDISESAGGIRKITVGEAVRILTSTADEKIEKHRIDLSDAFFKLYCHGIKAEKLKKAAHDLKDSGAKTQSPKPILEKVEIKWSPFVGDSILYRNAADAPWRRGLFCGLTRKGVCVENGVIVKEVSPGAPTILLPIGYRPIFRVNNRRLIQVA